LAWPAVASVSPESGSAAVQYRTLGKTGLRVTAVGYGTMITSDPSVIARAVDMGINYFDTARNYQNGHNERMVGAALGARRKQIFLASKSNDNPATGPGILAEIETSLKELNTDYLDVWHLHGLDKPADISDELVEAERQAQKQGKVRFIGVSTHNLPAIVDRVIEARIEVVQAPYNFASTASYTAAIDKLHKAGVGVIAMKVMAKGARRGRPESSASAALKWAIKNPAIATAVPSMTDIGQLEANFRAMSEGFTEADSRLLAGRLREIGPYFCRMCGECQGQCPKGLPVSDIVRFVMYADGYGQFPLGRERFQRLASEQRDVRCTDCTECAVDCPNGVQVAAQVRRAQDLFAC
jgi:aryl-alcohol dehydrogenase-like predicted oxidoreductase